MNPILPPKNNPVTEAELQALLRRLMAGWVGLAVDDTELISQMSASDAVESKVVLSGPPRLHLVLRLPRRFALKIGTRMGCVGDPGRIMEEAAHELANMLGGHLKERYEGREPSHIVHLPEKSSIREWPAQRPRISCNMRVGDYPVEIMLWDAAGI